MSKSAFRDGIGLNEKQNGLLKVSEDVLSTIIKNEPISNVYDVEDTPFARGKFAAVRRCTHKTSGVAYAAKCIRKRRRLQDQRADILHEVAVLLAAASSDRIVRLYEVYETANEMAIVLELAKGGELQRVVEAEDGLEEVHAVRVMKHILEALVFLHSRNIAHLDLKPQNILLSTEHPDSDIKLCDFGISRIVQNGVDVKEILGTPDYVAPEILKFDPISLQSDVWSVGVLAYVLLTGYSPFAGETKQETFCNITQGDVTFPDELFGHISPRAKHFIEVTLRTKPSDRLTAQECLDHPWICGETLICPSVITVIEEEVETDSPFSRDSPSRRSFACGAQCCQNDDHRHSKTSVVEILHDRGIIC
ncbi:death-associated protein kinase related-like [Macrosteles quadrilineatus]|uniref:death-associated protein kinase related-like n=1 Tax=Macrosteles quadrilineatus TaxID=74068 RepID=UPI0023E0FCD5|nr:death-associated protein kinase related-like [Macrosteles quadrilineatus]XP_054288700.1 death-associated protein kinase related-like [Macrosteles quadrilineatus]